MSFSRLTGTCYDAEMIVFYNIDVENQVNSFSLVLSPLRSWKAVVFLTKRQE